MTSKTRHDILSIPTAVNLFHVLTPLRMEYLPPHAHLVPNMPFLGHIAQTAINQRLAQYLYISTPKIHRSIAHIEPEYRRNATGVSPIFRRSIAEKATAFRRKTENRPPKSHPCLPKIAILSRLCPILHTKTKGKWKPDFIRIFQTTPLLPLT